MPMEPNGPTALLEGYEEIGQKRYNARMDEMMLDADDDSGLRVAPGVLRLVRRDGISSMEIEYSQASLCEALKSAFMWKHPVYSVSVSGADAVLLDTLAVKKLMSAVDALWSGARGEMIARASCDLAAIAWPAIEAMADKARIEDGLAKPSPSIGRLRI